jgi:AcrR family transcriptional regulator
MVRDYQLKRRAEQVEETRRRIVEAAIELHKTVGPAHTSVSAIAEQAGVQRQTYYRHFPDERSLFEACSGLYMTRNPLPDPQSWLAIADPHERLRHGLAELYAYYAANEPMLAGVVRDAEVDALTREMVGVFVAPAMGELRNALAAGLESETSAPHLLAALDLALDFNTWRLLVRRSGLSAEEAAGLALAVLRCLS